MEKEIAKLKTDLKNVIKATTEQRNQHKENTKIYNFYDGQLIAFIAVYSDIDKNLNQ